MTNQKLKKQKTKKQKSTKRSKIIAIICVILIFIGFLAYLSASWCLKKYGEIGFDAILFTMFSDLNGTSPDVIKNYLSYTLLPLIFFTAVVSLVLLFKSKDKIVLTVKKVKVTLFPLKNCVALVMAVIMMLSFILAAAAKVQAYDYIKSVFDSSVVIDTEYVFPYETDITFPEKKKNLIYILMESMESSLFGTEENGGMNTNIIPELYFLAEENVNFSENDNVGGISTIIGGSYTIAALVAQTAGIPLRLSIDANTMDSYSSFLPGAYTINDLLRDNGYNQAFMCGSDAVFGGRERFLSQHGIETIYDYYTAIEDGIISEDYYDEWWGMEDYYLYEYAKQKLTEMSYEEEPFAFFMLTVDTHSFDGHTCFLCDNEYDEQYSNVYSCASRQADSFVNWLKEQNFYEDTTIVLIGDHISMDYEFFSRNIPSDYSRRIYNCIINSSVEPTNAKNRIASQLDMFPTTLAAMGCTIEGNKLGLGVNLFSDEETICEKYTVEFLNEEFQKKSKLYDSTLLTPFKTMYRK